MPGLSRSARNHPSPSQKWESCRSPAGLKKLKAHIRRLEGFGDTLAEANKQVLPFGIDEIDDHLPGGGLIKGALHEVFAADAGIATAFCALLAGRLVKDSEKASILWCERPWTLDAGVLYGPALLQFGIDPMRLILVRTRRDSDALWAMEEGLRCSQIAAVVGELGDISLTASRRLQLAAEETGVTAMLLRSKENTQRLARRRPAGDWMQSHTKKECRQTNDNKDLSGCPDFVGARRSAMAGRNVPLPRRWRL